MLLLARIIGFALIALAVFCDVSIAEECKTSLNCLTTNSSEVQGQGSYRVINVDNVWAGTSIAFSAVQFDQSTVLVSYVGEDRDLYVATIDIHSGIISRMRLPHHFSGWDGHNYITMTLDSNDTLHIVADMHASPLVYFQGQPPFVASGFTPKKMIGNNEGRITYPEFVHISRENLVFLYRSGGSGDGDWILDGWREKGWVRLLDGPLFAAHYNSASVSAYFSAFVRSLDGKYHVAIVWRRTPDVSTNFRLSYAETFDFQSWMTSAGKVLSLPLSPENTETVDDTGTNAGLMNSPDLSLNYFDRPVVSYTKYDSRGLNAIFVAQLSQAGPWQLKKIRSAAKRLLLQGIGSIPQSIYKTAVDFTNAARPSIAFHLPGEARLRQSLDPSTLQPIGNAYRDEGDPFGKYADSPKGLNKPMTHIQHVLDREGLPLAGSALVWTTQGPNGDVPGICNAETPVGCRPPPTTLRLVVRQ